MKFNFSVMVGVMVLKFGEKLDTDVGFNAHFSEIGCCQWLKRKTFMFGKLLAYLLSYCIAILFEKAHFFNICKKFLLCFDHKRFCISFVYGHIDF